MNRIAVRIGAIPRYFVVPMLSAWLLVTPALAEGDENSKTARQYEALVKAYEEEGGARGFAERFLEFAEQNMEDPAAVDALIWVVDHVRGREETSRALKLLAKHHVGSEKLGAACEPITDSHSPYAEKLLRTMMKNNPHRNVRAQACQALAALLADEARIVKQLRERPDLAPRVAQYYGKQYGKHLVSVDPAKLEKKREKVFTQMLESFADVELSDGTMGEFAKKELYRIRHLSVGKVAPEIEGEDIHGKAFKLSDYRGKVVMLTFWGHW